MGEKEAARATTTATTTAWGEEEVAGEERTKKTGDRGEGTKKRRKKMGTLVDKEGATLRPLPTKTDAPRRGRGGMKTKNHLTTRTLTTTKTRRRNKTVATIRGQRGEEGG